MVNSLSSLSRTCFGTCGRRRVAEIPKWSRINSYKQYFEYCGRHHRSRTCIACWCHQHQLFDARTFPGKENLLIFGKVTKLMSLESAQQWASASTIDLKRAASTGWTCRAECACLSHQSGAEGLEAMCVAMRRWQLEHQSPVIQKLWSMCKELHLGCTCSRFSMRLQRTDAGISCNDDNAPVSEM